MRKIPIPFFCLAAFVFTIDVAANMRAPINIVQSPSSTLYHTDSTLRVIQEQLKLTCVSKICDVDVTYEINAGRKAVYRFEFILPLRANTRVRVNDQRITAITKPIQPRNEKEKQYLSVRFNRTRPKLHQAIFRARLASGRNRIRVQYRQPMSAFEGAYGYFRKSRSFHQFRYEIWPLKQWQLARGFRLQVIFRMKGTFSLFKSLRGRAFREQCYGLQHTPCRKSLCTRRKIIAAKVTKENGYRVSRFELSKNIPDILICNVGDKDLIR